MKPSKIGRFLQLLAGEADGQAAAVGMFHYVMMVEAMYLQMMTVYHLHNEDMPGMMEQLETFTDHAQSLMRTMSAELGLERVARQWRHGSVTYREITGLAQMIVSAADSVHQLVPFLSEENINRRALSLEQPGEERLFYPGPLWFACQAGELELARVLLSRGADINQAAFTPGGHALSCLSVAAGGGHHQLVQLLLSLGVRTNLGCSLARPCQEGDSDMVALLLGAGEDPNTPQFEGKTPLYLARQAGHLEVAELLVKAGADTDMADILGEIEEDRQREEQREEEEALQRQQEQERQAEEETRRKTEPRTIRATSMTAELKEVRDRSKAEITANLLHLESFFLTYGSFISNFPSYFQYDLTSRNK